MEDPDISDVIKVIPSHSSSGESESEEWVGLDKIHPESQTAENLIIITIPRQGEPLGSAKIAYILPQFKKHLTDLIFEERLTGEVVFLFQRHKYIERVKIYPGNIQHLACAQDDPEKFNSLKDLLENTLQMPICRQGLTITLTD